MGGEGISRRASPPNSHHLQGFQTSLGFGYFNIIDTPHWSASTRKNPSIAPCRAVAACRIGMREVLGSATNPGLRRVKRKAKFRFMEPRPKLDQTRVDRVLMDLLAQGFSTRRGRPRQGDKPLVPALAASLGITPRRAQQIVAAANAAGSPERTERARAVVVALRRQLEAALTTRVEVKDVGGTGTIVLHYDSYRHLESLMRRMNVL